MAESWVINASPVILLAKAGLIQHLPALAQPLVIPEPVAAEIRQGPAEDAAVAWIRGEGNRFIHPPVPELDALHRARIGEGEKSVIAWAVAHPGCVAVLDDAAARALALPYGVPLIGTIGVVLKLKQSGLIAGVRPHLVVIRTAGGFISEQLFRKTLLDAGEQP